MIDGVPWAAPLVGAGLVLLAVGGYALLTLRPGYTLPERDHAADADSRRAARRNRRIILRLGRAVAPTWRRVAGAGRVAATRRRLAAAGHPDGMTVEDFYVRKAGSAALLTPFGAALLVQNHRLIGAAVLIWGWTGAELLLRQAIRRRQTLLTRELPDFLDVLSVTMTAGHTFRSALARTAESLPGALAEEVDLTLRLMELGVRRRSALEALRDRNRVPELRRFVAQVLHSEELGTPLAGVVSGQAGQMRRARARWARRAAEGIEGRVFFLSMIFVMIPLLVVFGTAAVLGSLNEIGPLFPAR